MASRWRHCVRFDRPGIKGLLRYGSVRNYGTVKFWQKVRYGITYGIFRSTVRKYNIIFPYLTVHFPYSSNACFALLLPITALFLRAYNFTTSIALAAHTHHQSPLTISNNNIVNKLNCYAIIIIRLFNHNLAHTTANIKNDVTAFFSILRFLRFWRPIWAYLTLNMKNSPNHCFPHFFHPLHDVIFPKMWLINCKNNKTFVALYLWCIYLDNIMSINHKNTASTSRCF